MEKYLKEILSASHNLNEFIPIIGAGVSTEACLPTGIELTEKLKQHFKNTDSAATLGQAAYLIDDQNELKSFLCATYNTAAEPTDAHILLANLKLPCYISLNFDELLEKAIEKSNRTVDKIFNNKGSMIPRSNSTIVIKPHGTVSNPESLQITSEETNDFFRENPIIANMLVSQLANKTLLFIGFSFSDPDFLALLRYLKEQSGKYLPKGYAIMKSTSKYQEKICKEFNIDLIQSDATDFLISLNNNFQKIKNSPLPWEKHPLFFSHLAIDVIPAEIDIVKSILAKIKEELHKNTSIETIKSKTNDAIISVLKYRPLYSIVNEFKNKISEINTLDELELLIYQYEKYEKTRLDKSSLMDFVNLQNLNANSKQTLNILLYSKSQSVINFIKELELLELIPETIIVTIYICECSSRSHLHYEDALSFARQLQTTKYKIILLPDSLVDNLMKKNMFDLLLLGAHFVYKDIETKKLKCFKSTSGSGFIVELSKTTNIPVYVLFEEKKIYKYTSDNIRAEEFHLESIPPDVLIPNAFKSKITSEIKCLKTKYDTNDFVENKVIPIIISYN